MGREALVTVYLDHVDRGLIARKVHAPMMIMQFLRRQVAAATPWQRPIFTLEVRTSRHRRGRPPIFTSARMAAT